MEMDPDLIERESEGESVGRRAEEKYTRHWKMSNSEMHFW